MENKKIVHHYNEYHVGDCTWHVIYMRRMCELFSDLNFVFYCDINYHKELKIQIGIFENQITLKSLSDKPKHAINTWIGANGFLWKHPKQSCYNEAYADWFKQININSGIEFFDFKKDFTIFDNESILVENEFCKEHDILLINSEPKSRQFNYNLSEWQYLAHKLKERGYSVITTKKVFGIDCTTDYDLSLSGIASVSRFSKVIIGIHTAPILMCFNKWNINTVEHWYSCHEYNTFTYNDRISWCKNFNSLIQKLSDDNFI